MEPLADPFDGIPVLDLTPKGQPVPQRLKKPKVLREIFVQARDDDKQAAMNRADCQDLLDGGAPYDDKELEEAGVPQTTNINFRGAEDRLEKAMAPYYRMVQAEDLLVRTPTKYGDPEEREYFSQVLSEEISSIYRKSRWWTVQTPRLLHKYIWDGLGIGFFRDNRDFRYRAAGLGQFYFPRQSFTDENEHEVIVASDKMGVAGQGSLWEKISKAKEGEDEVEGWNVAAVKKAIQKATAGDAPYQDWELLMDELKNNDLSVANKAREVRIIHGFVQEFDGTVSHYIATEECYIDGGGPDDEDFLYICRGDYTEVNQVLTMFAYGLGTNTKTHGIRGLGYKIYPFEQQFNRSMGRMIDCGYMASSMMLKAVGKDADYSNAGYQMIGNSAILDPDFEFANVTMPDLADSVMPVIEQMRQLRNERTSGYTADSVFDGDQRKTKFEITAGLEQTAELSDVEQDFFFLPFITLMRESVRRLSSRSYVRMDPGGKEVQKLRLRLAKRGIPLEALFQIDLDEVTVVRGIGGGSASSRTLKLQSLEEMYGRMDDVGKANYDWDKAASRVGTEQAARYFSRDVTPRTTTDTQIAILQNAQLIQGINIPVLGTDRHLAHAREHLKPLVEMYEAAELGQIDLAEAATQFNLLYEHTVEHVTMAEGDPATEQEVAALNEMLQRIGEVIGNGLKEAEARAQEAEEQGEPGEGPSVEEQARLQEAQNKIDMARESNAAKIEAMQESNRVKNAIADAAAGAKIRRDDFMAKAKAAQMKAAAKKATKKAAKKAVK